MVEFAGKRNKRFVQKADGSTVILRPAYRPVDFVFPTSELKRFDDISNGNYGGFEDILDEYDGVLSNYHRVRRFERDGKAWILLQHPNEYAIDVELTRQHMGEIRPLPPEEAWRLARELDQRETRYPIEIEPGSALP